MLTLLIRTSNRPKAFSNLLTSINGEADIIVSYDRAEALQYIPKEVKKLFVYADNELTCFYNLYCNELLKSVEDGWMLFADDDDTIIPGAIAKLKPLLANTEPGAIIVQFMRGSYLKPHPAIFAECKVREGHIGLPCLILHSKYKDVAKMSYGEYADSHFIRDIIRHVPTTWVRNMPVVSSPQRGRGVMEK